jgi:urease accessory protein
MERRAHGQLHPPLQGEVACATFAANRAVGRVCLAVAATRGVTRRTTTREDGSLRVRFPNACAGALEAVLVNTAGGIAGGDRFAVDLALDADAQLTVTTAAAEKIYRSLGPDAGVDVSAILEDGAALAWLPQETILFDRARLRRTIEVDLAADARLLLAEAAIFGRSGMGETVAEGFWLDRWRVRRGGRLLHAETVRLDGNVAAKLAQPAVAKGGVAMATVLVVPGDEAIVAAVRAASQQCRGEIGASAWNGLAVMRLVAADGAALRHDLACVLTTIRGGRLPRLWLH